MLRRFQAINGAGYPYFVAEMDGRIAGYAYANAYRTRPGLSLHGGRIPSTSRPTRRARASAGLLLAALIDACNGARLSA